MSNFPISSFLFSFSPILETSDLVACANTPTHQMDMSLGRGKGEGGSFHKYGSQQRNCRPKNKNHPDDIAISCFENSFVDSYDTSISSPLNCDLWTVKRKILIQLVDFSQSLL